jgi:Zn-dependent peptidase ImmA (M78 family)
MPNSKKATPEDRAVELLESLGIRQVPVSVDRVARALGAEIRFSPLDEELSGSIFIKDGVPIIGVNSLHHPNRQRFTIAHELGHLRLHRHFIETEVHVDKQFAIRILRRDPASATGTELKEIEANQFAAALLMPRVELDKVVGDLPVDIDNEAPLEALARKFKVSRQALEFRINNLR